MNAKIHSTDRRRFLKGMAVGAGGYALGSLLIHSKEANSINKSFNKITLE